MSKIKKIYQFNSNEQQILLKFRNYVFMLFRLLTLLILSSLLMGFTPARSINDTRMFIPVVTNITEFERENFYLNSIFSYIVSDRMKTQSMKLSSGEVYSDNPPSDFDIGFTLNLTPQLASIHSFRMQGLQIDLLQKNDLTTSINYAIYRADLNSYGYGGSLQYHLNDSDIWFGSIQKRYLAKDYMKIATADPASSNHVSTLEDLNTFVLGFEKRFISEGQLGTSYLRISYYYNSINSIDIKFEKYSSNYQRSNYDSLAIEIGFIGPDLKALHLD